MYIRSDVAFRWQTGLAMLNLSFVNPDPKRPFTTTLANGRIGWEAAIRSSGLNFARCTTRRSDSSGVRSAGIGLGQCGTSIAIDQTFFFAGKRPRPRLIQAGVLIVRHGNGEDINDARSRVVK